MPEPETDKFRESPTLSVGLKKPDLYPIREMVYTTEDEAYQFRVPNTAYNDGSAPHDLPDGLQSDGTPPRHWGDVPTAHEDNTREIRHNPLDEKATEEEKAVTSKMRGEAASRISDPARKREFIAEQGNLETKGKLNRISQERLKTNAALEY